MAAKVGGDDMIMGQKDLRQCVPAAAMVPAAMNKNGERRAFMRPFGVAKRHAAIEKAALYSFCTSGGAALSVMHHSGIETSEAALAIGNGGFPYCRNRWRKEGFRTLESLRRG